MVNPPGMFKDGGRQQEYSAKYLLPTSGRLIPEFDKRRSIKDMFTRKPASSLQKSTSMTSVERTTSGERETTASKENTASNTPTNPIPGTEDKIARGTTRKRNENNEPPPSISLKRSKSSTAASAPAAGQKTLKGFFKPKGPANESPDGSPTKDPETSLVPTTQPASQPPSQPGNLPDWAEASHTGVSQPPSKVDTGAAMATSSSQSPAPSRSQCSDAVIDPIVSKEDWSKLFSRRSPPTCESHQEPCISLTTKKPGINYGRAFWICQRPLGPSGNKEKGTQWRCATFIWASDWNSPS